MERFLNSELYSLNVKDLLLLLFYYVNFVTILEVTSIFNTRKARFSPSAKSRLTLLQSIRDML